MATVLVNGQEVEIGRKRAAELYPSGGEGRRGDSGVLLASGAVGRRQLSDVPCRSRR